MQTIYADAEHSLYCGQRINDYKTALQTASNNLEKNELYKKQHNQVAEDAYGSEMAAKREAHEAQLLKEQRATLYMQQVQQMTQDRADNVAASQILHDVSVKMKAAWERYASVDARWGVSNGFLQTTKTAEPTAEDYVPSFTAKIGHSASKSRFQLEAALGVVTSMCNQVVADIDARKTKMETDFEASQAQLNTIIDFQNGEMQAAREKKIQYQNDATASAASAALALNEVETNTNLILDTYNDCKFTLDNYKIRQEKGLEEWKALREVAGILTGMIPESELAKTSFVFPSEHMALKQSAEAANVYNRGRLMAKFDVVSLQTWKDNNDASKGVSAHDGNLA